MNKKIIGILVIMLLISTAVLPVMGTVEKQLIKEHVKLNQNHDMSVPYIADTSLLQTELSSDRNENIYDDDIFCEGFDWSFSWDESSDNEANAVSVYNDGYIPGTFLLKTTWHQIDLYAMKTPLKKPWGFRWNPNNHWRLGCWSTAIGQIINYYHQLQSSGEVHYECPEIFDRYGNKVLIDNNLSEHVYNWSNMPNRLTIFSTSREIDSVSTFLYDVATVIQKNFGTYYYVLEEGSEMVSTLLQHFDKLNSDSEWAVNPPIIDIQNEIDNFHPCMLYMENKDGTSGHAVVIDGYKWEGNNFIVHLNFGWGGASNNWYDYDQPIDKFDSNLRGIMFIRGDFGIAAYTNGPYLGKVNKDIQFYGSALGGKPSYSWHWDFGDSTTSNLQNPTHQYLSRGRYTATLTVTDYYGDASDDTAWVGIIKCRFKLGCEELGTKGRWLEQLYHIMEL